MEITLQLNRAHVSEDYAKVGDINDVFYTLPELAAAPGLKFYYLHIQGVPEEFAANAAGIHDLLIETDYQPTGETDPDIGGPIMALRNRRRWCVTLEELPELTSSTMLANGEATGHWDDLRAGVQQKLTRIAPGAPYHPANYTPIKDDDLRNA